nr:uncharacterized mitochondrial protein AtMg00810-like [Tanacetum cinerariifolium]
PYTPSTVVIQAVPVTENSPEIREHTAVETILNMAPANKAHFQSEKDAIQMILTGIEDEIYSTLDACKTTHEMLEPIERLQQGESLNIQDTMILNKLRDKDMQKNLALIAKYFKKIYKPTNNNLRTSSNTRNKNVDTTPRYKNDNQTGQFRNQRTMTVARARETVGGQLKRVKDFTYHKEKMLMCKQAEKGVPLQAEQYDWLANTNEEIDEQELKAHYSYMAKIQEVPIANPGTDSELLEHVQNDDGYNVFANEIQHSEQPKSISKTCVVETGDSNVIPDSPDMCDNDIQNDQNVIECGDVRVALANLIANIKLDVDENKKIQKQLKKANASLTQELIECKSILGKTSRTIGESNSIRDSFLIALQYKQTEFERYKAFNDRTVDYEKLERKLNETLGLLAQKEFDIKEGLKVNAYEILVVKEKHDELVKQSLLTKSHYEGLVKEKIKIVQLIIFIVDSGCTRHMTGNLTLLCNFIEKYLGLNHNLFSVGQFCDADLKVAFQKSTCFVTDLQGNNLLTDYENSGPVPQLQNVSPLADTIAPSQQELDLLFGPMYDEFFNEGTLSVNKSSSPTNNSKQQDIPPTTNNPSSTEPITPTSNVNAEENNDHQAEYTQFQQDEFINPLCTSAKYALEILKKHGIEKGQSIGAPMVTKPKLDADLSGTLTDQTDYHSKTESLMYLTSSGPDIVLRCKGATKLKDIVILHTSEVLEREWRAGSVSFLAFEIGSVRIWLYVESKALFDSEIGQISLNQKKQHVFNVLNAKPLEVTFLKFIKLVIISMHSYLIQMLVVMPFNDLKFGDIDDSTFGVDILSIIPVDRKSIELLTFGPSMRDSPESIFVIADWCLTPHFARLLQERIQTPPDSCMILHQLIGWTS